MDLMFVTADLAADLTAVRAALACLAILGRIMLLFAAHHRAATTPDRRPSAAERIATRVVTAAQTVGAALTILDWLCDTGIVRLG